MVAKSVAETAFFQEPAGSFALGKVLVTPLLDMPFDRYAGDRDIGIWQCDLTAHDALTWSDAVYDIFGLPHGSAVSRDDAVAMYREHSRGVLERIRSYAIKRQRGFLLDAALNLDGATRWIRILAAPVVEQGRVVGLRGLKRVLEPRL